MTDSKVIKKPVKTIVDAVNTCLKLRMEYCRKQYGVGLVISRDGGASFIATKPNGDQETVVVPIKKEPRYKEGVVGYAWDTGCKRQLVWYFKPFQDARHRCYTRSHECNPQHLAMDTIFDNFLPLGNHKLALAMACDVLSNKEGDMTLIGSAKLQEQYTDRANKDLYE